MTGSHNYGIVNAFDTAEGKKFLLTMKEERRGVLSLWGRKSSDIQQEERKKKIEKSVFRKRRGKKKLV